MNLPNRRRFLGQSAALLSGTVYGIPTVRTTAAEPADDQAKLLRPLSPLEFRRNLAGPILSLPTTFNRDLSVDYSAVNSMVARARSHRIPVFELTAGNSKYSVLTYDEIKAVTRAMVAAVEGDGLTIAATGAWATEQVMDYARVAESAGADALQILRPADVQDEDAVYGHFRSIAAQTRLPLVLHGQYSASLMRRLVTIDSIVAAKEDGLLTDYIDKAIEFGDRLEIFSGGAENRYLVGYPYGARAFFATYSGFAPDIPMKFWAAVRAGDLDAAVAVNRKYDHPFIKRFSHPFWHATLEYFDVAQRYLRKPFTTYTAEQMTDVKTFFDGQGLYPADYA